MRASCEAAFLSAEFQEQSSARIQLSRTNDFFPGTSDRIMLVAGPVNQVTMQQPAVLHLDLPVDQATACGLMSLRSRHRRPSVAAPAEATAGPLREGQPDCLAAHTLLGHVQCAEVMLRCCCTAVHSRVHFQLSLLAHALLLLQVLTALHLIVGKIRGEPNVSDSLQTKDGKAMQLRLLVHSQLCGSILGKAGSTIKSFAEDSRAQITVSPQDRIPRGATDRIVRIAGGSRS